MPSVSVSMNRFPNYDFHELANCWPLATSQEHKELVESIKKHGQKEKITLFEKKILDGRNRYNACKEAGVKPEFETLKAGEDPATFVIAKNNHRRNLSVSQKAVVAAKLSEYYESEARKRMLRGKADPMENFPQGQTGTARDMAGKSVGVSGKTVDFAKKVLNEGAAEVVSAVESGELKVSTASRLVDVIPDKTEQKKIIQEGAAAVKAAVADPKPPKLKPEKSRESVERSQPVPSASPIVQIQALLAKVDLLDVAELILEKLDGCEEFEKLLREKCPVTTGILARPNEGESDVTLHDIDSRTPSESASPVASDDPELESQKLFDRFDASGRATVYATISDLWRVESGGKPKRSNVFIKPTLEQVTQYCNERKNNVDPEKFYDYYQTQGWKLANGNSMKDWQSAIRTWEKSAGTKTIQTPARPAGIPLVGILPPAEEQPIRPRKDLMDQFKKLKPFEPVES